MKWQKISSAFLFVLFIIFFIWLGSAQPEDSQESALPLEGFQAPPLSLYKNGSMYDPITEDEKRPLVINFWASWCPPCHEEMEDLIASSHLFEEEEVKFVGVNMLTQDTMEDAKSFIEEYKVPYINLFDEEGTVSREYQVRSIPTTFIIDAEGYIRWRKTGALTKNELIQAIHIVREEGGRSDDEEA
ncbi:TlpA family protein disulfide reductase [Thalassorhabdus alkalitolerans]|uniref:TlpA family protein disulfide reductase n=2 Tax=Bacillaceae TaxID=186817 RepID=A0ABW0YI44_9BACI